MQLELTKTHLKQIARLAKEKRARLHAFRDLHDANFGTKQHIDEKLRNLTELIEHIVSAVKCSKLQRSRKLENHAQ